ncbi:MAG TPA: hypothetical protein VHU23_05435 [Rhizomicrobium sp.]|jgi:hypothetical protein|nr:hypothetical protein [Rhizomicrobium sp.]
MGAMVSDTEMNAKVAEIVEKTMPSAEVVHVDTRPMTDSDGEKSLSVTVVVRERPASEETALLVDVVDKFRTWLVTRNDDRFPYFRLRSENEEREIREAS